MRLEFPVLASRAELRPLATIFKQTLRSLAWFPDPDECFSGLCGASLLLQTLIVGEEIIHFVFFRK